MRTINPDSLSRFAAFLGPKGFTADPDDIDPWLTDWRGVFRGAAPAMLLPKDAQEVAACVALAAELGVALVPQGGNTGMCGGATPLPDGQSLILSTRRMNRVRTIDPVAGMVVAEAGVILSSLHDAVGERGMRFPLTLGAKGSATIGGLCSTNAGGTQVLRFGTMRKLVLGIEAVLPDGTIHEGLAVLKKDTRGYDLSQLLVGAEGTLGIITAASLKLVPAIADRAAVWMGVASPQDALKLLRFFEARSGDSVESFELMPEDSLDLVLSHIPGTRRPLESVPAWNVLVEYVVSEAGVEAQEPLMALAAAAMEAGLVSDAVIASSEAQIEAFWKIRDSIAEAERASGPAVQHDISVPVDLMPDFMTATGTALESAFPGTTAASFGHLGDGNVHLHVRAPAGVEGAAWRAVDGKRISATVYDLVTASGGSISAEHGIGQLKRHELARLSSPARIAALRAIKAGMDPLGIMNPGKLVPLASDTPSP